MAEVNTERKIKRKEENLYLSRCILSIENLPSKAERHYDFWSHNGS